MFFTTSNFGNLIFTVELLVAEILFLYGAPKRKHKILRLICYPVLFLLIGYFFPLPIEVRYTDWFSVIRFLSLFFISTLCLFRIFNVPYSACLTLCGAGYAAQHFSYQAVQAIFETGLLSNCISNETTRTFTLEGIFFPIFYVILFFIFARPANKNRHYFAIDFRFDMVAFFILLICVGLSRLTRRNEDTKVVLSTAFYAMTCCLSALIIQFYLSKALQLSHEKVILEKMWEEDKKHYEFSKERMEQINIKAHDLKHKLLDLQAKLPQSEIDSMKKAIDEYDSHIKTGNDSLDVVLNEKMFICKKENISFTFLGDGKLLNKMNVFDIYSVFGNILDNSIEALKEIEDKDKKVISMNIEEKANMIFVIVKNYYKSNLCFVDGLPLTTKDNKFDNHGYGMKSIRKIANQYHGDISISANDDIFTLTFYIEK